MLYWAICVNIVGCVYSVIPIYVAAPLCPPTNGLHTVSERLKLSTSMQQFRGHLQNIETLEVYDIQRR